MWQLSRVHSHNKLQISFKAKAINVDVLKVKKDLAAQDFLPRRIMEKMYISIITSCIMVLWQDVLLPQVFDFTRLEYCIINKQSDNFCK